MYINDRSNILELKFLILVTKLDIIKFLFIFSYFLLLLKVSEDLKEYILQAVVLSAVM